MKYVSYKQRTKRSIERKREDHEAIHVIIKRNDEVIKDPDDMLERAIIEGRIQSNRRAISLLISSFSAGLILGFSVISVSFANSMIVDLENEYFKRLIMALFYPLGFIMCIVSGAQLFTEHTALAVYPVLDRRCKSQKMFKQWFVVLSGNLMGTFVSSYFLWLTSPITKTNYSYVEMAQSFLQYDYSMTFISAIMAGWLMALGSWLVLASTTTFAQMVSIFLATFLIGISGFHHSIVGAAELFTAKFTDTHAISSIQMISKLSTTIVGNLLGGSFLVAILNYAHIKKTQEVASEIPRPTELQ